MLRRDILLVEGREAGAQSLASIFENESYPVRMVESIAQAEASWEQQEAAMVVINWLSLDDIEKGHVPAFARKLAGTAVVCSGYRLNPDSGNSHEMVSLPPGVTARKLLNQARRFVPDSRKKEKVLRAGDMSLNVDRRVVTLKRQWVEYLTPQVAGVLACLLKRAGQVVSRQLLMREVWETDFLDDTRTLDVHIRWLREAIEVDPGKPKRILTVRGEGYVLMPQESP